MSKPTKADLLRDATVLRRRHKALMARPDYYASEEAQEEATRLFDDIVVLEKGADEIDLDLDLGGGAEALRARQAEASAAAAALHGRADYDKSDKVRDEADRLHRTAAAYHERADFQEGEAVKRGEA